MAKYKLKSYWEPTPKLFRVIGDTFLSVGSTITAYGILEGDKKIALISLVSTILGKFLTNLATVPEPSTDESDGSQPGN